MPAPPLLLLAESAALLGWAAVMLLGFAGSAMYSGLETGAYSLNRVRLHVRAHQHDRPAERLRREVDNPARLLSTLLIGNNIANYIGTAGFAVILAARGFNDWQAILINVAVLTPALFVFGETLPKDLFAAHADRLMYRSWWMLTLSRWVFTAVLLSPAVRAFSAVVIRLMGRGGAEVALGPRRQVHAFVQEGVGHGLLSDEQSALVDRVLALSGQRVHERMVPWRTVTRVDASADANAVRAVAARTPHTRLPVVGKDGRVAGVVSLMEALAHEGDQAPPIAGLMHTPLRLSPDDPVYPTLRRMQRDRVALAVVEDAAGRPLGVVGIKDLVEPITGRLRAW